MKMVVVGEYLLSASYIARGAFNLDGVRLQVDRNAQPVFEQAQVFVTRAEQRLYVRGDLNVLLHSVLAVILHQAHDCGSAGEPTDGNTAYPVGMVSVRSG